MQLHVPIFLCTPLADLFKQITHTNYISIDRKNNGLYFLYFAKFRFIGLFQSYIQTHVIARMTPPPQIFANKS